jgi:hypothetical protein
MSVFGEQSPKDEPAAIRHQPPPWYRERLVWDN